MLVRKKICKLCTAPHHSLAFGCGAAWGVNTAVRLSLGFGSLPRSLGRSLVQVSVLGLQPLGASSAPARRACETS